MQQKNPGDCGGFSRKSAEVQIAGSSHSLTYSCLGSHQCRADMGIAAATEAVDATAAAVASDSTAAVTLDSAAAARTLDSTAAAVTVDATTGAVY